MPEKKLILKGVFLNYVHFFVKLAIGFILTAVIVKNLGQASYGLWVALGSVIGYFGLFDFGMNTAVTKYTAEYYAQNNKKALEELVSSVFVFFIFIGVLIIIICASIVPLLPNFLRIPKNLVVSGQISFMIMSLNISLGFLSSILGSLLYGYHRIDIWRGFGIIQALLNFVITVLFLRFGFGLIGVVTAAFLSTLILMFLFIFFIKNSKYNINIIFRLDQIKAIKKIVPYSIRAFVLGLTAFILYYAGNIVISIFLGVSAVTPYAIAYQLCIFSTFMFSLITQVNFPKFTDLYTLNDINKIRTLYIAILKLSVGIVVPIIIFLWFFGQSFINTWVGKENFVGFNVFAVLIIMNFFHALGTTPGLVLQAIGKNEKFMYSEIISAILNLSFSIFFIKKIGILSVVLGMLIGHLLTSFWIMPLLIYKYLKLPLRRYLFKGIILPLLLGVPVWLITQFYLKFVFSNENFFYLGIKAVLIFCIYAIFYFLIGSTVQERRFCIDLFFKNNSKK